MAKNEQQNVLEALLESLSRQMGADREGNLDQSSYDLFCDRLELKKFPYL